MRHKHELLIGLALATLLFLAYLGVNVLPLLLLGGLLWFFSQRFNLGRPDKAAAGVIVNGEQGRKQISFDDVGGQVTAKQELREALDFIRQEESALQMGIRPLKGILLTGPPGTGKTLLAKAAAAYTDAAFIAASGSEFIEVYAGVGAQRVRQLFEKAQEQARKTKKTRAIIFIDEIDVLGGKRGQHSSHLEYDQTLNQLLVEMDGMTTSNEVRTLIVGATNRPDLLDSALLRPGRFDRIVRVDLPDKEARLQILKLHVRNKPLAADVCLDKLASDTQGFSGAHLESLANEAAILAMREQATEITNRHFQESIEKVIMGERTDKQPGREELRRVAIHEAGHALVAEHVRAGSVSNISILSRGNALGYVRQTPGQESYLQTEQQMMDQLWVLLAGAAAEELYLGSRSTGAGGDYQEAVKLARHYILAGLSSLGIVDQETVDKRAFAEVQQQLLNKQAAAVKEFLGQQGDALVGLAEELLIQERMDGAEVRLLLAAKAA